MPRPLIIKVVKSVGNSNNTVPHTRDLKSPRIINKSEVEKVGSGEKDVEDLKAKRLVRNLINLYEFSTEPESNLIKAKSLTHLVKPNTAVAVRRKSEVEMPVKTKIEPKKETKFDFKTVWNKFETHNSTEKIKTTTTSNTVRSTSINSVQEKAKQALEQYRKIDDNLWRERVVALLKEICNESDDKSEDKHTDETFIEVKDSTTKVTEKSQKVYELKNVFERQTSIGATVTQPKPSYEMYFSSPKTPEDINVDEEDFSSSSSESDSSENSQGSYNFQQPTSNTNLKIMELKSYFEPSEGVYKTLDNENDDIPPSGKITVLEHGQIAGSMEKINYLMREVEKLQSHIDELSKENSHEANQINEKLIQLLIKLDEVDTFGEATLQAQRKKGILLVQTCIKQLMDKKRS